MCKTYQNIAKMGIRTSAVKSLDRTATVTEMFHLRSMIWNTNLFHFFTKKKEKKNILHHSKLIQHLVANDDSKINIYISYMQGHYFKITFCDISKQVLKPYMVMQNVGLLDHENCAAKSHTRLST